MNTTLRRFFLSNPLFRTIYVRARKVYRQKAIIRASREFVENTDDYKKALLSETGEHISLRMKDGLRFTVRSNRMDATILAEVFFDDCYVRGFSLPNQPIVVDVGGYIGDFTLYALKRLHAAKVVVCEPSPSNWNLLVKNVADNHYEDRVEMEQKAVTDGQDILLDVDAPDRGQARVSAYYATAQAPRKCVPGISVAGLMEAHHLDEIDLLKIDCEGGEYTILSAMPELVSHRIHNLAFEYHEIDGFRDKLEAVKTKLKREGFSLTSHGMLISAARN